MNKQPFDWTVVEKQISEAKKKLMPNKNPHLFYNNEDISLMMKLKNEGYLYRDIAKIMSERKGRSITRKSIKDAFYNRIRLK